MGFAETLQNTAFARWVGESGSLLGYPTILFLHTLGLAALAGLNASINLRILGVARTLPLSPLLRFFPLMRAAFLVTLVSGVALLVADATTKLAQPVFYVKLLFVALAVINLELLKPRVLAVPTVDTVLPPNAKLLAATSMIFLLGATIAGRLIAYIS